MYLNIELKKPEKSYLEINKATLNGKKFILKYKWIPTGVVNKIQSIGLKNKSIWERFTFIGDALKLCKSNWLFGLGGNAWRTVQSKAQSYQYYAQEVHCFPVQIFLENGIVGLLAVLGIGIGILTYWLTQIKSSQMDMSKISFTTGLIFLLLHSCLDFDLSFFYSLLIVFFILATMDFGKNIKIKADWLVAAILIAFSLYGAYVFGVEKQYKKSTDTLKISEQWPEDRIFNTYHTLLPFHKDVKIRKYRALNSMENVDYSEIKKVLKDLLIHEKYMDSNLALEYAKRYVQACLEDRQGLEENLKFVLTYIYDTQDFAKYRTGLQFARFENLVEIKELLTQNGKWEQLDKIQKQLEKEIDEKEAYLLDYKKARYLFEQRSVYEKEIQDLKNKIKESEKWKSVY